MENSLRKINDIALKLLRKTSIQDTYLTICNEVIRFTHVDYASIYVQSDGALKKVFATHEILKRITSGSPQSFTYKSYTTHRALTVYVEAFGKQFPEIKKMGIKTSIFVPLSYEKTGVGVLVLQSKERKKLGKKTLDSLELIGSMASLAINNAKQYRETTRLTRSRNYFVDVENALKKIYRAGLQFLLPLSPEETYSRIVHEALKLVGADYGSIILEQAGKLERVYATTPELYQIVPRRKGITYTVFRTRKPQILTRDLMKKIHPEITHIPAQSDIIVPLSYKGKSIGVLTVQSTRQKYFSEKELQILHFFTPLASLAIQNSLLYDETKKALELRDLFISIAAHELRTPLTTLNGYIQLLQHKYTNKKGQETEWIHNLAREGKRLTRLIQELLEINKIQTGKLHYDWQTHQLSEVVNTAINNFRINYPTRSITFKNMVGHHSDTIVADHDKIVQVIMNILINAAKFSDTPQPITVQLSSSGTELFVQISDKGRGISKEDLEQIFNLFYKGSHNTQEGMGLGLFLAKNIINTHNGSIAVDSKLNRGTTVIITLPNAKL